MTFRRQTGVPCDIRGNPHFAVAKIARPNGENTRPIGENIRPRGLTVLTAGFIPTSGVFLQERRTWYIHTFLHMQIFEVKINALRSYVHYRFCHGEMDQGQNLLQICVSERDTWQLDGPHFRDIRHLSIYVVRRLPAVLVVEWCIADLRSVMVGLQRDTASVYKV